VAVWLLLARLTGAILANCLLKPSVSKSNKNLIGSGRPAGCVDKGFAEAVIRQRPATELKSCLQRCVGFIKAHTGSLFLVRRWTRFPRLFPRGGFCMGGMHFFAPEGPSQLARPKVCGWRVSFCMRHSLISAILPNRPANPDRTPGFARRAPRGQIC